MKKLLLLALTLAITIHLASTVFAAFIPLALNAADTLEESVVGLKHLTSPTVLRFAPILIPYFGFGARDSP